MKQIIGQYECSHRSGIGLDYFTSRLDRLTLQANGHFNFIVQERSRISHTAKSLLSGQQADVNAPETRREGSYSYQGDSISFYFDDGTQEQGQLTADGIQIGNNFFEKVSDSTLLPPTHRMKSNLEDIAKGLKIAEAIGGAAIKAAKTVQDTLQAAQGSQPTQTSTTSSSKGTKQPVQGYQAAATSPASTPEQITPPTSVPPNQPSYNETPEQDAETFFCDQCGAPARPGKHFCSRCGARLP
jgi:zinc ribbon protein